MKICYVAGALKWELLLSGLMIDTKLGSIQSSHQRRFLAGIIQSVKSISRANKRNREPLFE